VDKGGKKAAFSFSTFASVPEVQINPANNIRNAIN
jgi:hypothetical protein